MTRPTPFERALVENHHTFTALHRGTVEREPGAVRWESDEEAFRCVLLDSRPGMSAVRDTTRALRTFPWSADAIPDLERAGFQPASTLRYMHARDIRAPAAPPPDGLSIGVATDDRTMADFTSVQSRAFLSPGEDLDPLYEFLHRANRQNLHHPAQTFYVARLDEVPVAVTLLLIHEQTAGIYAVATLPAYRSRGLSRVLLTRAMTDARSGGCDLLTLQVYQGSDAERLYTGLGFSVAFDCTLWGR